jgi:hypothetical protein
VTATPEPIFRYHRTGFTFEVYPNRIEVTEKKGLSAFTGGNKHSILARTITGVEMKGITRKLSITTNDGKRTEYQLGTEGEAAREAVLSIL